MHVAEFLVCLLSKKQSLGLVKTWPQMVTQFRGQPGSAGLIMPATMCNLDGRPGFSDAGERRFFLRNSTSLWISIFRLGGVCLKCAQFCFAFSFSRLTKTVARDASSAAQRRRTRRLRRQCRRRERRLRCHGRHVPLSVRMAVAAAFRHSRDLTRTAVDAAVQVEGCVCVWLIQGISQERIKEQIVEQNVDVPVSQTQEQVVDPCCRS